MAIWDSIKGNQEKGNIEKLLNYFKKNKDISNRDEFIKILEQVQNPNTIQKIMPDDTLCEVLETIHFANRKPSNHNLQRAKQLYQLIVYDSENKEQLQLFNNFFALFIERENLFKDFSTFSTIYNIFDNKKLIIGIFRSILENQITDDSLKELLEYICQARQYYVDESAYYSAVIQVIKKLESPMISDDKKDIIQDAIEKDKRVAGFYDIDENSIENLKSKVESLKEEIRILKETKSQIEGYYTKTLNLMTETIPTYFQNQIDGFTNLYDLALNSMKQILEETYNLNEEKQLKK